MARNMPGRKVSRPAQGKNSGMREDPKWAPTPQAAPPQVSTGSVSHPKSTGRWNPKPQAAPGQINTTLPAS
jgi:hypothetical protein